MSIPYDGRMFYFVYSVGNLDGTLNEEDELPTMFETFREAEEWAKAECHSDSDDGLPYIIFQAQAVHQVKRTREWVVSSAVHFTGRGAVP